LYTYIKMPCHPKNAFYVKRWRENNKDKFAEQHREHSRVYYLKRRVWRKIALAFLQDFADL